MMFSFELVPSLRQDGAIAGIAEAVLTQARLRRGVTCSMPWSRLSSESSRSAAALSGAPTSRGTLCWGSLGNVRTERAHC
jgi:hypothetical protein